MAGRVEMMYAVLLLTLAPADFDRHVADLSHRQHKVRAVAAESLYRMGTPALPRLESAKEKQPLDVRRRLESIAARIRGDRRIKALDLVSTRYGDAMPMIDAWWYDGRRGHYDAVSSTSTARAIAHLWLYPYLSRAMGGNVPDPRRWGPYRQATAAWFVDMAEAGVPVCVLDILYLEMRRRDNRWIARNSLHPFDPWHWPGTKPPAVPSWMPVAP
jgi:hypothetical protein